MALPGAEPRIFERGHWRGHRGRALNPCDSIPRPLNCDFARDGFAVWCLPVLKLKLKALLLWLQQQQQQQQQLSFFQLLLLLLLLLLLA